MLNWYKIGEMITVWFNLSLQDELAETYHRSIYWKKIRAATQTLETLCEAQTLYTFYERKVVIEITFDGDVVFRCEIERTDFHIHWRKYHK